MSQSDAVKNSEKELDAKKSYFDSSKQEYKGDISSNIKQNKKYKRFFNQKNDIKPKPKSSTCNISKFFGFGGRKTKKYKKKENRQGTRKGSKKGSTIKK